MWVLFVCFVFCFGVTLPPRLVPGDTVGFLSPSSPPCNHWSAPCPSSFQSHVVEMLAALGLKVKWGKYAFAEDEYLAGTDEERASDLNAFFLDDSVKAIVATRGGEGSARMLHLLNFTGFPPKIICGYSDVTSVINSVHQMSNFVTFHGPMGLDNWASGDGSFFKQVLMGAAPVKFVSPSSMNPYTVKDGVAKVTNDFTQRMMFFYVPTFPF